MHVCVCVNVCVCARVCGVCMCVVCRDASATISTFGISILDCLQAVREAVRWRWLDFSTFNVYEYELYEVSCLGTCCPSGARGRGE